MKRTWVVARFLARGLFLSLMGIVPIAAAVTFGLIAFEYGMDQAQFFTVAGLGTGTICLATALLLAARANHAWFYPLLARLSRRGELLAAIVLSSVGITALLALLIAVANLATGRLTLHMPSALWLLPTWLALWLLAAALALPLSSLTSRSGSHLALWALFAALLIVNDQKSTLLRGGPEWAVRLLTITFWPVTTLLSRASAGVHDLDYFLALLLVLGYALFLFVLAAYLFGNKDLLWAE
ncbi:MAG: hypothetical protein RBU35_14670 [Anaerolineae bacterium]|jgi:hypothetical protein|nr:hypothetical protein [Anaerolineae bacterium]